MYYYANFLWIISTPVLSIFDFGSICFLLFSGRGHLCLFRSRVPFWIQSKTRGWLSIAWTEAKRKAIKRQEQLQELTVQDTEGAAGCIWEVVILVKSQQHEQRPQLARRILGPRSEGRELLLLRRRKEALQRPLPAQLIGGGCLLPQGIGNGNGWLPGRPCWLHVLG